MIRRRLGTVGNKSPLHNIRKALEGALKVLSGITARANGAAVRQA